LQQAFESLRPGVVWRLRRSGIENAEEAFEKILLQAKLDTKVKSPANVVPDFRDILVLLNSEVRKIEMEHLQFSIRTRSLAVQALRSFYGSDEHEVRICDRLQIQLKELTALRAIVRRGWRA
jgi:hypothetical protein